MKKHSAIFTVVRNERIMLPIWLNYYRKHFDDSDIFVINSYHEPLNLGEINVCTMDNAPYEISWVTEVTNDCLISLLDSYNYVMCVDADEFVVPLQHDNSIKQYIDYLNDNRINTVATYGFNLVHDYNTEPKLDLSLPILNQRKYIVRDYFYDKPLLTKYPLILAHGLHSAEPRCYNTDTNLVLLHLKSMDYDILMQRQIDLYSNREPSLLEIEKELAVHNRNLNPEYIKQHFFDELLPNRTELDLNFPKVF